jgi:hypothetical protein
MENEPKFTTPEGPEKKTYTGKVICSYCKKDMGEKEGFDREGAISHGICPECLEKEMAKIENYKENDSSEKSETSGNETKKPPEKL